MKLLSSEILDKYDFLKTYARVKEYMSKFEDDYYRYISILPPSITSHLSDIKVQTSYSNTSPIESYIIKKSEKEKEFVEALNVILKIIYSFNAEEQRYFKGAFFLGNSDAVILDELQCSDNMIKHIKKSTIIKFALAMDIAVLK
jgi:ArpU family phage transcriptional regulator